MSGISGRAMRWLLLMVITGMARHPAGRCQDAPPVADPVEFGQSVVVKLFGAGLGNLDSYGSGVLISSEGHVLTIWNHLINTGFLTAVTDRGERYAVEVVGTSRDYDIAVLKLQTRDDPGFPHIDLNAGEDVAAGESVLAFSNMFHVAAGNEPVSVVRGVIAARVPIDAGIGRWKLPVRSPVYVVDAITNNSGAGGGLLTTRAGTPVGLIGRELRYEPTSTWISYSVPLSELAPVVESLIAGDSVDSATTSTEPPPALSDRELTARFGITLLPAVVARTPSYIDAIVPGSVAAEAGLRRGDLIVLLDDDVIVSVQDFRQKLAERRPGQPLTITVQRDETLVTASLRAP